MKIVFIADAHLKGIEDPNQGVLVRFLDGLTGVDVLVMLGDIFEFLTCSNSVARLEYEAALKALERLSERGVRIIYIEGNHDFSLRPLFKGMANASVHPGFADLTLGGKRFYLSHGDTVSMTSGYSVWRGFLRSPLFSLLCSILPDSLVWSIANYLSRRSRGYGKAHSGIDRRLSAFAAKKVAEGFDVAAFGHSHAPGVHDVSVGGKKGTYVNPGSFMNGGRHLVYEDGRWRLG